MANGQYPAIDPQRCIGCGTCINVCKPGAIEYRSDWQQVLDILNNNENKAIAIIDPSYVSEFNEISDYRKVIGMLKFIGFSQIYDTSFAVDLLSQHYNNLFKDFKGKHYITANCPVVITYIEKYLPSIINNIAPLVTPMSAMARIVRKINNDNSFLVYIGPCIAAKEEARLFGEASRLNAKGNNAKIQQNNNSEQTEISLLADSPSVDYVLTFEELRLIFNSLNVQEKMIEFEEPESPNGYLGYLYPISNGIIQAGNISESLIDNIVVTGNGKNTMIKYLNDFEKSSDEIGCHFNIFFCKGCIMGPGSSKVNYSRLRRRSAVVHYAQQMANKVDKKIFNEDLNKYLTTLDLSRTFHEHYQPQYIPTEEKIKEILISIGKTSMEDEVDCRACGYETCREFAIAVSRGLTTPEMCITFAFKNQLNYIHSLKLTNEKLARIQEALIESEKKAKLGQERAEDASETLTAVFQKLRAGIVIFDNHFKIIRANQSFINILGEEAMQINEVIPGLEGADIKTLLPYTFYHLANYALENNEEIVNRDIQSGNELINVSIFPIRQGKILGAIIRDLYQPDFRKEELINRLNEVINKNLDMVQKIGFLLGEGASETEHMLNSIIQTFKSKDEQ
jgi:iron only hydrogenase large subunit-like protein